MCPEHGALVATFLDLPAGGPEDALPPAAGHPLQLLATFHPTALSSYMYDLQRTLSADAYIPPILEHKAKVILPSIVALLLLISVAGCTCLVAHVTSRTPSLGLDPEWYMVQSLGKRR